MKATKLLEAPPEAGTWDKGWYSAAKVLPSPNFGTRPVQASIDLLVIHSISLPPGQFGNGNVQRLFLNELDWNEHPYFQSIRGQQVSSHFFISREGQLWQFVSCDARAWHAGLSSYRGKSNCNDDSIGIELEGLEGGEFEAVQYRVLARICTAVMAHYPVEYIAGHEHIACGRKHDPGNRFDWALLQNHLSMSWTSSLPKTSRQVTFPDGFLLNLQTGSAQL